MTCTDVIYSMPLSSSAFTQYFAALISQSRLLGVFREGKPADTVGEGDQVEVVLDRTPIPGEKDGKSWGGYAGLSVRIAKHLRNWEVVDSEGRKGLESHGKKARWVDFSGNIVGFYLVLPGHGPAQREDPVPAFLALNVHAGRLAH